MNVQTSRRITHLLAATIAVLALATPRAARAAQQTADNVLESRIATRLDDDMAIKKYDVHVSVKGGMATLTGTVATAAQKTEAGRTATISGVSKVDNQIVVDKDADKTMMERAKAGLSRSGDAISDSWITTKVHYRFVGEDLLKDSNINVDTNNKVVTLKGTVKSTAGKTRAVAIAKGTEGVMKVVDQLTIGSK